MLACCELLVRCGRAVDELLAGELRSTGCAAHAAGDLMTNCRLASPRLLACCWGTSCELRSRRLLA
eukprot:9668258-Lingulodinium_polyedra.AAC.1